MLYTNPNWKLSLVSVVHLNRRKGARGAACKTIKLVDHG